MLSVAQARQALLDAVTPPAGIERLPLEQAFGRVLATPERARVSVPPMANSAMDGYALNAATTLPAGTRLPVCTTIAAGVAAGSIAKASAARIFTGAALPANANAVVMQEDVLVEGDTIITTCAIHAGDNVRPAGEDIKEGTTVAARGTAVTAVAAAMLAAAGVAEVDVYRPVRVVVFNTGRELTEPGEALAPGGIYNSNRLLLQGLLAACNCRIERLATLPDNLEATVAALESARDADLIITTGGVSVGDEDHVKQALNQCGHMAVWKVLMKPGKPLAFGFVDGAQRSTPVLGLPGNPVSAGVSFLLFAVPLLERLQGRTPRDLKAYSLTSSFSLEAPGKRPQYLRVRRDGDTLVRFPHQGSGILSSLNWANGLALIPPQTAVQPGDKLAYFPFAEFFGDWR